VTWTIVERSAVVVRAGSIGGHSVPVASTEDQGSSRERDIERGSDRGLDRGSDRGSDRTSDRIPDGADDPGGTGDIDAAAADLRIELEIEARRRERWIRHRLSEEATLRGALAAAVGRDVAVQLLTGNRVSGTLAGVGSDVIEVRRRHGATWVSIESVTALEVAAALPAAGPPIDGTSMVEVLCDLVDSRTEVLLTLAGGTAIRGELRSVGAVATVDTGPGGRTAYVPVAAVVSVAAPI